MLSIIHQGFMSMQLICGETFVPISQICRKLTHEYTKKSHVIDIVEEQEYMFLSKSDLVIHCVYTY
jgi:hypothetical protein